MANRRYRAEILRSVMFTLLALVFARSISAQEKSGFLDRLTEKFNNYCRNYPREEIYVHTDRDIYVAGEKLWLKVYLFDRQRNKPSTESKIVYLEILNPENKPVVQRRIKLDNGSGPGQMILPDTLSSGNYILRAYTNWMKNFLPENCFSKTLCVYNALRGGSFKGRSEIMKPPEKNPDPVTRNYISSNSIRMMVRDYNAECISISLICSDNYRITQGSQCYLFIQTNGNIDYKSEVNLYIDSTKIIVPRKLLSPGINDIALFGASGGFVNEEHYYTPVKETVSLSLMTEDNYDLREKLTLGIAGLDSKSPPDLSVSVVPVNTSKFPDIGDYMIFGSEFGNINYGIPDTEQEQDPTSAIKGLLPSLQSNWINWNNILTDKKPLIKYEKEVKNHYLYGRMVNKDPGVTDSARYVFVSIPGKTALFQYSLTDRSGNFKFSIPSDGQIRDLILQPGDAGKNNTVNPESSFSDRYPVTYLYHDTSGVLPESISRLKINFQVEKIYSTDDTLKSINSPVVKNYISRFYGKPDIEIVMDDYIKLPVMQEVFFELIPGVVLKNKKSEYQISMWDPVTKLTYEKPPTLFVDGVVVHDPSVIGNLDPEIVEKIDVVNQRYYIGDYQFFGIVNVITRAGDFSSVKLPDNAMRLPYRAVDPVESFHYPDYSTPELKKSRIPDFRNTLYWNPGISNSDKVDLKTEFWLSDYASEYEINIEGVNGDGTPVSLKKIIGVK